MAKQVSSTIQIQKSLPSECHIYKLPQLATLYLVPDLPEAVPH